jgi:hypothetical protein
MAFCINCGTQLPDIAKFCGKCGTPVQAAAEPVCSNCGSKLNGNNFCLECGTPAQAAVGPSAPESGSSSIPSVDSLPPKFTGRTGKVIIDKFGSIYEGDWVNGNPHGKGKKTTNSGASYEGEWAEGNPHGKGKFIWSNGDIYEGDYVCAMMHGKGKMTYADGRIEEGEWKHGTFVG